MQILEQCRVKEAEGGGATDTAWIRLFVDDALSLEVKHEEDGGRCLVLTQALASHTHVMLGDRTEEEEQVVAKKMTD